MDAASEEETACFLARLFEEELEGHPLMLNRSLWRRFPTIANARWSAGNVVLVGDAAHTAHFSVGSGTRLAMLDAIALAEAMRGVRGRGAAGSGTAGGAGGCGTLAGALEAYEAERRRPVESLQRAAQASLQWFEDTERYFRLEPVQFAFSLLTRSLRISHENLRERDPAFVDEVDRWVAQKAEAQTGVTIAEHEAALGIVREPEDAGSTEPGQLPQAGHSGQTAPPRLPPPPPSSPPSGSATWFSPTGSACRPCASTLPKTAPSTTGTWSTWGRARSAALAWS